MIRAIAYVVLPSLKPFGSWKKLLRVQSALPLAREFGGKKLGKLQVSATTGRARRGGSIFFADYFGQKDPFLKSLEAGNGPFPR
jgi:hypothetical protein